MSPYRSLFIAAYFLLPVMLLFAGAIRSMGAVDPRLEAAYKRTYFSQQFPSDAVNEIQKKLESAPRAVEVLNELTKNPRPEVRLLTVMLLGELGETDGAKALWSLLRDESETVRLAASGALIRLAQMTGVGAETALLKDKRTEVRRICIATIGRLKDLPSEPALIGCLEDEEEMVRTEAVNALREYPHNQAIEKALLARLQDQSVDVRWSTVRALGGYVRGGKSPESVAALERSLKDPDWHVRAAAAFGLGGYDSPVVLQTKLTDTIVEILNSDEFALVRDRAGDALTFANSEKVAKALVESLVSTNSAVRFHAARAMCSGKTVAALPLLMGHTKHTDTDVRERIMEVFGAIGDRAQVGAIIEATDDAEPPVRLAAVNALSQIAARDNALVLSKKLSDADPHVRAAATRGLGLSGDKTHTPKLIPLLHDEHGYVRTAAAEALGKLGDRAAVKPLLELLTGTPTEGSGMGLVVNSGKGDSTNKLEMTVSEQKTGAAMALGELRSLEAVEALIKYGLKSKDADLQRTSAHSLGRIGDRRAVDPLQDVVRPYYQTLKVNTMDAGPIISDGKSVVADSARQSIEKQALVRTAVAWALGQIGDPSGLPILRQALNDQNSLVRDAAIEALAKMAEREEREKMSAAKSSAQ